MTGPPRKHRPAAVTGPDGAKQKKEVSFTHQNNALTGKVQPSPKVRIGFNPKAHPLISRHWFGIEPPPPWQHISQPLDRTVARIAVAVSNEESAA